MGFGGLLTSLTKVDLWLGRQGPGKLNILGGQNPDLFRAFRNFKFLLDSLEAS